MANSSASDRTQNFYMGFWGAVLPFVVFVALITALSVTHSLSSKSGGAAALTAVVTAFFVIKDKNKFSQIVYSGFKNDMLAVLLSSFLLAGVMAIALTRGGLVDALVWAATMLNVPNWALPLIIFIIVTMIGLATGTNAGTIATTMPIMLPLGVSMGCDTALVMGAIVGGAMWGDNIAPISDTTIVSALTQETEVAKVVKARFKYAGIAGILAMICYAAFGVMTTQTVNIDIAAQVADVNQNSLLLLLSPLLVIILMLKGKDIIFSLLIAATSSVVLDVVLGLISIKDVLTDGGVIVGGFTDMMGIFPFFMFMFVMIETLKYAGVIEWIGEKAVKISKTPRTAEIISALVCTVTYMVTTVHSVSVVVSGPIVRSIMRNFNVDRARSANLTDCIVSGLHGTMPHSAITMIAIGIATDIGLVPKGFSPISYIFYVFPSWFLLIIFMLAIVTGFGRKQEMPQDEFERMLEQDRVQVNK